MCRWLAYKGSEIYLNELIFEPKYSLIEQSMSARKSITTINADGFGLGWYGNEREPGLYREVLPAWSDCNLKSLSQHIQSPLFFAHVRASTGASTSRVNCHPFRYENWLFMHNGQIGGYDEIKWELERLIPKAFYSSRNGQTDSELLFLLLLSNGLVEYNVDDAVKKTINQIEEIVRSNHINEPLRISACWSDGDKVWALRYASDQHAPTLFYKAANNKLIIASEPLDNEKECWTRVPQSHLLFVSGSEVSVRPLQ